MREATAQLLEKARRAVEAAQLLHDHGDEDFAAGRVYYPMFYVAEALLHEEGVRFGKHSAVHATFGERFAKTARLDPKFHRWLLDAFDSRPQADYGFEAVLLSEDVEAMLDHARAFLDAARSLLES